MARPAQVGRRPDPLTDAEVVLAVRRAVGPVVHLRADANGAWSAAAAAAFATAAAPAALQYLEEPLAAPVQDLVQLYRATGMQMALDECLATGGTPTPACWGSGLGRCAESASESRRAVG